MNECPVPTVGLTAVKQIRKIVKNESRFNKTYYFMSHAQDDAVALGAGRHIRVNMEGLLLTTDIFDFSNYITADGRGKIQRGLAVLDVN
ncbi:putative choline transporter, neither null mutation nor overexpression affects choline transport [Phytophthora pseudosyringae]|uniref:Putative choline transporter, neither null mutation nor overexpression affects choline transport n=1 Tax=Phytophthora pseudosyringae TaxID=221518 RepID=A0A8T1V5S8_9STRA|nr:putative choline transporter, neither null mutation nor overexpression affects choline transport [Phytophthora pseudosyringae]